MATQESRNRTHLMAVVELYDGWQSIGRGRVRDISPRGLGAKGDFDLEPGQQLAVELKGIGRVTGVVRWTKKRSFGLQFDREVELEHLDLKAADQQAVTDPDFKPVKVHSKFRRSGIYIP